MPFGQSRTDGDHWRAARVDRLDDLRVAQADAHPELSTPSPTTMPLSPPDGYTADAGNEFKETVVRGAVMYGPGDVRVEDREAPEIVESTDAVIRVSAACVCGSDLWPYRGVEDLPWPAPMGHEYAGLVEEVGADVQTIKPGQFVVGSFWATDNTCPICRAGYQSACVGACHRAVEHGCQERQLDLAAEQLRRAVGCWNGCPLAEFVRSRGARHQTLRRRGQICQFSAQRPRSFGPAILVGPLAGYKRREGIS